MAGRLRAAAAVLVLLGLLPHDASAQDDDGAPQSPGDVRAARAWSLGTWVGGGWNSPTTVLLGKTPGRDHFFLGLQAARPFRELRGLKVSYTMQVLPVVRITGRTLPQHYHGPLAADGLLPDPHRAHAFGFSPIGFEITAAESRQMEVFGAAAGGALIFARPFPVREAQRVNFTMEFGAGVRVRAGARHSLEAGYKFHHLSNGYMAHQNPGLDAHVFYAGYRWRLGSRPRTGRVN